jgi:hypothetical protein
MVTSTSSALASPPGGVSAGITAPGGGVGEGSPPPATRMGSPQCLHVILKVRPVTFSSAT